MLPGFAEGQWWVQDAAAALPARLFGDVAGKTIADLCAAPGGKTAQLAQAGARVTAVDRSPGRMARLRDNLARLSLEAETVVADAAEWPGGNGGGGFDGILVDAPCTSTGTIRRHPDVAWLRQEADIARADRRCRNGCCRRRSRCSNRAGRWSTAPVRWNPKKASKRSRRCSPPNHGAPRADRGRRGRGPCRDRDRRRRSAHPALPSAA